jgi:hypothetical protein
MDKERNRQRERDGKTKKQINSFKFQFILPAIKSERASQRYRLGNRKRGN